MYPLDSIPAQVNFLKDKIVAAQANLGISDVFYGDQERIPRTPAVCIEPGEKTRDLNGAPRRVMTEVTTYILIYHNPVTSTETIREQDDNLAEAVEALIHADPQFRDADGNAQVIDSLVSRIESGYQQKRGALYRASRLTVDARVQAQLPSTV